MRTCTDCAETKPIDAFLPIASTKTGFYGRCRVCPAKRAKERYWTDPREREMQIQRVRRNRTRRRRQAAIG